MPKVKVPRKSTAIDMTAMCDVAFLLLTFFMLTTKFKPPDPMAVDIPGSKAELPLPDRNIMLITVGKEGTVFFGVDDQNTRLEMLNKMAADFPQLANLTEKQKNAFRLLDNWGCPIEQLPQILDMAPEQRDKPGVQPGIKVDTTQDNQLSKLILYSRLSNSDLRIAVKADKDATYEDVSAVIETLKKRNLLKFNLVTAKRNTKE
jgi:biopolymer transport protein ExbD